MLLVALMLWCNSVVNKWENICGYQNQILFFILCALASDPCPLTSGKIRVLWSDLDSIELNRSRLDYLTFIFIFYIYLTSVEFCLIVCVLILIL